MLAATIVNVQVSPATKSGLGSRTYVVWPPDASAVWPPLTLQSIVNQVPAIETGSLKVTVLFGASSTFGAPAAGVVDTTVGATSPVVRGFGAPALKSAALSSVSVAPFPA